MSSTCELSAGELRRKLRDGSPLAPNEAAAARALTDVGQKALGAMRSMVEHERELLQRAGVNSSRLTTEDWFEASEEVDIWFEAVAVQNLGFTREEFWKLTPRELVAHFERYLFSLESERRARLGPPCTEGGARSAVRRGKVCAESEPFVLRLENWSKQSGTSKTEFAARLRVDYSAFCEWQRTGQVKKAPSYKRRIEDAIKKLPI